jgi:hypothetical protein
VGARFGKSRSSFDAFGERAGDISLKGSAIGICRSDGECLSVPAKSSKSRLPNCM